VFHSCGIKSRLDGIHMQKLRQMVAENQSFYFSSLDAKVEAKGQMPMKVESQIHLRQLHFLLHPLHLPKVFQDVHEKFYGKYHCCVTL